jgi:hypothetical protein
MYACTTDYMSIEFAIIISRNEGQQAVSPGLQRTLLTNNMTMTAS